MRKTVLSLLAIMVLGSMSLSAQTVEEMEKMMDRYDKLSKILEKTPKVLDDAVVDTYNTTVYNAAKESQEITKTINTLYEKIQAALSGDVDNALDNIPSRSEITGLSDKIEAQAKTMKGLVDLNNGIVQYTKSQSNPLKMAKIAKGVSASGKIYKMLGENILDQGKAVKDIISQISKLKGTSK